MWQEVSGSSRCGATREPPSFVNGDLSQVDLVILVVQRTPLCFASGKTGETFNATCPCPEARQGLRSCLAQAIESDQSHHRNSSHLKHPSPWQSSNEHHGQTDSAQHGGRRKVGIQDQAANETDSTQNGGKPLPKIIHEVPADLELLGYPEDQRHFGKVGGLNSQSNERNLDPPPCVVDVRAKQKRKHQGYHGKHHQDVGQLAEVFEMHAMHHKHHTPPACKQCRLFEQKLDTVSVGLVGQGADCTVHGHQGRQGEHQGNPPEHAVTFEATSDASDELVHGLVVLVRNQRARTADLKARPRCS